MASIWRADTRAKGRPSRVPFKSVSPAAHEAESAARGGGKLVLGLDLSTQSLTAVVVEMGTWKRVTDVSLNFDSDFPEYGTKSGMMFGEGGEVHSPVLMWIEALDELLARLRDHPDVDMGRIVAVSGSGQQHGSVYWSQLPCSDTHPAPPPPSSTPHSPATTTPAAAKGPPLWELDPAETLKDNLQGAFTRGMSPIWADSSTSAQCARMEARIGGAHALAALTGSRAYTRFTVHQIAKIAQTDPDVYNATDRISLVSSMLSSLLTGAHVPVDQADASGMNLMDLRTGRWSEEAARAADVSGLLDRLGPDPVPSQTVVGTVAPYLVQRYGLSASARVVACTGDNPSSVAGLGLQDGDAAVSLGTSDTLMTVSATPVTTVAGHVMVHPAEENRYFAMLCFANGSPGRELVRDRCSSGSWAKFSAALERTDPGNDGHVGFYYDQPEILPTCAAGVRRFGPGGNEVHAPFQEDVEVRAVVESKFLSMRHHMTGSMPARVIATGGGAVNQAMMQVLADVMGAPVWTLSHSDSAALGACYRAAHGAVKDDHSCTGDLMPPPSYTDVVGPALQGALTMVASPCLQAHATYSRMLDQFATLQSRVVEESTQA